MSQQEMIQMLDRYLAGTATLQEQQTVEQWLDAHQDLNNEWELMDEAAKASYIAALYQKIQGTIAAGESERKGNARLFTMYRSKAFRWIAAASIIIIVGLLVMLSQSKHDKTGEPPVATRDIPAPTETRAVITLADGRKIYLDSADNGTLALEGQTNVIKTADGKVVYSHEGTKAQSELVYNTLTNPRGSKVIDMTLSDGSHVWLNSGSSVKYPVAFIGKERIVEITGEAYFEVKHNAQQPFKVHLPNGSVVEDLGTAFNINAYPDEQDIKTTLVEGSLRVFASSASSAVKLKPGQQAVLNPANPLIRKILVQDNVDVDEVLAWKNGKFSFNRSDIKTVMRQLARWYDLEVVYDGPQTTDVFGGDIQRDLPLSKTLDFLKKSQVSFELQGKKLIVRR